MLANLTALYYIIHTYITFVTRLTRIHDARISFFTPSYCCFVRCGCLIRSQCLKYATFNEYKHKNRIF